MYINRKVNKLQILLSQDKRVFRTSDLAVLWQITNKNTLLTTIRRYITKQALYRIKNGVYSTMKLIQLHPYELGCALAGPLSYVTTETALFNEGEIAQNPHKVTLMGKKQMEIELEDRAYLCRYSAPQTLVNRQGIVDNGRYSIASKERARVDLRRVNPRAFIDKESL